MSFEPAEYLRHILAEAEYVTDVEWRAMAGMRDHPIHDYLGVDHDLVWDVRRNNLPDLIQHVRCILASS